jgi:hypothetical protein
VMSGASGGYERSPAAPADRNRADG